MHQYGKKKIILHIQNSVFKYICCCTQSCHYCISATLHQYQESVQLKHEHHFLTSCKNKKTAKRSHEGSLLLDNHMLLTAKLHFLEMNARRTGGCSHPVLSVKPLLRTLGERQDEEIYRSSDYLNHLSLRVQLRAVGSLLSL